MSGIIALLPMIDLNSWPGYHPWNPRNGIETFKSAAWIMWGNGSYKLKNLKGGMTGVEKMRAVVRFCFTMGILGLGRHLSGDEDSSR